MHYSAKRGLAIACCLSVRLSVRLSVTLVDCDHTGWNSSKLMSRLVSVGRSLSADPNINSLLQGSNRKFWPKLTHLPVDLSVGDIRSQIAAEQLEIAQRSQWRAYRKSPSLFRMVPSLTHTTSPSPKMVFHMPHDTRMAISPQRVIRYTSCLVLGRVFRVGGSNGAISGYIKSKMAADSHLGKFWMAVSPQRVMLSTSC